jgi:hypothetical protein
MTEPTIRDSVTRLAVLGAVLAEVKSAYAEARTEVEHYLNQQHTETGASKLDALLPDGTKVGSVARAGGEVAAQVTDEEALTAWVRDHFPSEHIVEIVPMRVETRVQPGFVMKLLAEATAAGTPQYADPATGVIHDVPGVEIRPSRSASVRMTYSRRSKSQASDGKELIAEAWRTGGLAAHVLPALAAGPTPAPSDASDAASGTESAA